MAGIHQTLKEVRELYASLMGSAERAERAVERVEDLEKRVAGLVHKVDETAQVHEKRLREAYRQMENIVDHESRMVYWFSRTWIFLLALMWAGFMGATAYHLARTFTDWVERTILNWWAG